MYGFINILACFFMFVILKATGVKQLPVKAWQRVRDKEAFFQISKDVIEHAYMGWIPLFGVIGRAHDLRLEEG